MNSRILTLCVAAAWTLACAGPALARNPHCAGGIQYVVNGMKDKDKGNIEDWRRQMNKAVFQLQTCAEEDAKDTEALGYLGWAYAELDSMKLAGEAFQRCIAGFEAKGNKKKIEWARNNRDSYWARSFNEGIGRINDAQTVYENFCVEPEDEGEKAMKQEAARLFEDAIESLQRAAYLRPTDGQTVRNLGTAYVFMCRYQEAAEIFSGGLEIAPDDEDLKAALRQARTQYANQLIDEKRYDDAIAYFEELATARPDDSDVFLGLADARFRLAQTVKDESRSSMFKDAGDAYAKAASLRPGDADLSFNAALAYQNAREWELSAEQWQKCLEVRPGDSDALSAYASTLAEIGKFDEAIEMLHRAIGANPREQTLHRQLGAVYTKAGDNSKATEELLVYLALNKGQAVDDPAAAADATAKAHGGVSARTLATEGVPEAVVRWEADGDTFESWFYWSKHFAYHFKGGTLQMKSDWSAAAAYMAGSAEKK